MNSPLIFKEYIWLVNTIYHAKKISLKEISDKWKETEMSGGLPLARSTFNRHKDAIEDIFGIFIECERAGDYKYYIGNAKVLEEDTIQNWMLSTLSVNNIISECRSVHDRIILEPIPSDGEYLQMVIDAMKENVLISFTYQKYGADTTKEVVVEPYLVKLFHRRWYLICRYPETKEFRTFSFDRILTVESTSIRFKMDENFDANEFFNNSFGIVKDNTPMEHIVVRAYQNERYYLRDLPMHQSQKLVNEGENYVDYEYNLCPTLDFFGYLLSRGSYIKVLEPQWVAEKVKNMLLEAVKRYENEENS